MFDDSFDTIYADKDNPPPGWEDMCIFQRFQVEFDDNAPLPELDNEWLDSTEASQRAQSHSPRRPQNRKRLYQDLQSKDALDDTNFRVPATPNTNNKGDSLPPKGDTNPTVSSPIRPRESTPIPN